MTILLPIPTPKKKFETYFLPYNIKEGYINKTINFEMRDSEPISAMREHFESEFGIPRDSYICNMVNNQQFTSQLTCADQLEDISRSNGILLCYEIDPTLKPSLPEANKKYDNYNNIDTDVYTPLMLDLSSWEKGHYRTERKHKLPRMLWVKKSWNLQELQLYVFKFIRGVLAEWVDWADPDSKKEPSSGLKDLKGVIMDFPYRTDEDKPLTRAEFDSLTDEEAFKLCCPGTVGSVEDEEDEGFDINNAPYQLTFRKTSKY